MYSLITIDIGKIKLVNIQSVTHQIYFLTPLTGITSVIVATMI